MVVTITLHCPHCGSEELVRDGHAPNGKEKISLSSLSEAQSGTSDTTRLS